MTELTRPSGNTTSDAYAESLAVRYGGNTQGFVVPPDETLFVNENPYMDDGPYSGFTLVNTSGLQVTIGTGEAVVAGRLMARDEHTQVHLPEFSSGVIAVGWTPREADSFIIKPASDFGEYDQYIPLWEFDTDGSGVSSDPVDVRSFDPNTGRERRDTMNIPETSMAMDQELFQGFYLEEGETLKLWSWGYTLSMQYEEENRPVYLELRDSDGGEDDIVYEAQTRKERGRPLAEVEGEGYCYIGINSRSTNSTYLTSMRATYSIVKG